MSLFLNTRFQLLEETFSIKELYEDITGELNHIVARGLLFTDWEWKEEEFGPMNLYGVRYDNLSNRSLDEDSHSMLVIHVHYVDPFPDKAKGWASLDMCKMHILLCIIVKEQLCIKIEMSKFLISHALKVINDNIIILKKLLDSESIPSNLVSTSPPFSTAC